jgi:hypothetical protein
MFEKIKSWYKTQSFAQLLWAVPIAYFLHELEEWNVISWELVNFPGMEPAPVGPARMWLIGSGLLGFFLIWIATRFKNQKITAYIAVPIITIAMMNGAQHIVWSISFVTYSPGLIFGGIAGVSIGLYFLIRAAREKLVHIAYILVFAAIATYSIVQTALLGHTMSPVITAIHGFVKWLAVVISS